MGAGPRGHPVKVVLAAIGSRGDVVPLARLARRFVEAGHSATVVTHAAYSGLVEAPVALRQVASDPSALLAGPAGRAVVRADPRLLNETRDIFAEFLHSAHAPTLAALDDADVLIASTFAVASVHAALQRSVPVVRAHLWPEYSSLSGPMPLLPYAWRVPGPLRGMLRSGLRRVEPFFGGVDGSWRRGRLHLEARHPVGLTTASLGTLYGFSPRVVPDRPRDGVVTGWWTDHAPGDLSRDVALALGGGDDWIYVGFGSMPQADPDRLLDGLATACERLGVRAIVQVGPLRGRPYPRLFCIGEEPHAALFPRMRAVVHHGGAGTTGSAIRAGVPSVVVPHFADQFYWGDRLHRLGVAPRPSSRALSSPRRLARLLAAALEPGMAHRASTLAERVRDEDGCGRAVRQVEDWVGGAGRR